MKALRQAVAAGQLLVYVSLGTVLTTPECLRGNARSAMTGKQLCRSVFRAVFEELGAEPISGTTPSEEICAKSGSRPLIIVSVGPEAKLLAGLRVPSNVMCRHSVPQLDVLRLKPSLFVTHCGQNSFMESLAFGVPMVACPGWGDQPVNAAKVQTLGVGLKVDRPSFGHGFAHFKSSEDLKSHYKNEVRKAVRAVLEAPDRFAVNAQAFERSFALAGGLDEAVNSLLVASGA
eukprot:gnl/TRDRNA2_/TRDRNA2_155844_c1_seq1.p1 gnl/TRDRNA2_/TRDRNA2_155844_c1~~gnl/TRDRNA2_/TRDRNA2_155844_c1_seq1.p1  ORF type:complete len:232 (+),score=38.79 gnl/TRDRNA2_/TRDRNA2_155844_c1_seq1:231-926(+)